MNFHGLHVLLDDDPRWRDSPVEQARAACSGGAQVLQLRAKHAGDQQVLEWAREIRSLTRSVGATFVVNDRFDLALAAEADAVHLGQSDLAPAEIPASAREKLAIGRSTHSLSQALEAALEPIDYLAFGPLFGTTSKDSEYEARGLTALREISSRVTTLPIVAIGGIDATNAASVIQAGARGVAVIGAVAAAADSAAATRKLVALIRPALETSNG